MGTPAAATGDRPQPESAPPVTGAWRPGDPVADRRFVTIGEDRRFFLEGGGSLRDVSIAYETWGELDASASNAVLVCHALTGDAHAAGRSGPGQPSPGWWDDVIGPGKVLDTTRLFVVCVNVLGGCQGSTGPSSINPATGRPYGSTFPQVSIRDMVRTQATVADRLGVARWRCVIGGSMGGMQALEWGVMYPTRVRSLVLMATAAAATAQQIGFSAVGRNAIMLDANWRGGDYYDAVPGEGPHRGLMLARQLAQITYRTDEVFSQKFGRDVIDPLDTFSLGQRFNVENYLDYQGNKLVRRFDANSYLAICKAMDLHDVGRGRGGIERALARVTAPTLTVSIDSDALYFPYQQEQIRDALRAGGTPCDHVVITSPDGHDAFLLAIDQLSASLGRFLDDVEKSDD